MRFDQQVYKFYYDNSAWLNRAYRYLAKSGRKFTQAELAILAKPAKPVDNLTPFIDSLDTRFTVINDKYWSALNLKQWHFDKPINETEFVVFDLESTGSVLGKDEVFEIGAVKLLGAKQVDEFHAYLCISQDIPPFVIKMTGVEARFIKSAKGAKKVLGDFVSFLNSAVLVAHNSEFDYNFIYYQIQNHNIEVTPTLDLCTWLLAKALITGNKRYGLSDLASFHKGKLAKRHSAIYDAKMTASLFQYLFAKLIDMDLLYLSEVFDFEKQSFQINYSLKKKVRRFKNISSKKNKKC